MKEKTKAMLKILFKFINELLHYLVTTKKD